MKPELGHIREAIEKNGKTKFILDITMPGRKRRRTRHETRNDAEFALKAFSDSGFAATRAALMKALESGADKATALMLLQNASLPDVTLREMVNLTIETKRISNRSPRHIDNLYQELHRFAEAVGPKTQLRDVGTIAIEQWLATKKSRTGGPPTPVTRLTALGLLSVMFEVAIAKGYLEQNPVDNIERPQIIRKEPNILRPHEVSKLFSFCRATDPNFLPWLTLAIFAGVRAVELEKLPWSAIRFEENEIVIDASISKNRRRRVFQMEPIVVRWLQECNRRGEFIFETEFDGPRNAYSVQKAVTRHRRRLCERAGVKWNQGVQRSTAASYLFALCSDELKVGAILGCCPKVLHRVRSVVRAEECQRFWALSPAAVPNIPIQLPKGGHGVRKPGELTPATAMEASQ